MEYSLEDKIQAYMTKAEIAKLLAWIAERQELSYEDLEEYLSMM